MEDLKLFLSETSIHGFIHFSKSKKSYSRIFTWLIIISGSLLCCLWQSAINIRDYLEFNVLTKVEYTTSSDLSYPAITVWNPNYFRRTVFGRTTEGKMLIAKNGKLNYSQVHSLKKEFVKNFILPIFFSVRFSL